MNRQKRTPGLGEGSLTHAKGGARDRLVDAGSRELARLAKKVGNSQVGALLGDSKEKQRALLAFIEQRLARISTAQRAEQKEAADQREWFLRVGRRKPGFHLLDPTRWQRAARAYRRAAEALCRGDIGRGAQLLEEAVRAEKATFETVPDQVQLPSDVTGPAEGPEEGAFVNEGDTAPPTSAPEIFKVADRILNTAEVMSEMPVERNRKPHRWWDAPEEEPEDTKKKPGGAGGKASEAPSSEAPAREEKRAEPKEKNAEVAVERVAEHEAPVRLVGEVAIGGPGPKGKKPRKK